MPFSLTSFYQEVEECTDYLKTLHPNIVYVSHISGCDNSAFAVYMTEIVPLSITHYKGVPIVLKKYERVTHPMTQNR